MADMAEMKTLTMKTPEGEDATFEVVDAKARNDITTLGEKIDDFSVPSEYVVHIVKLWQNESPSSSFGEQTITAENMGLTDLSEYDYVEIDFNFSTSSSYGTVNNIRVKVGNNGYCLGVNGASFVRRRFTTSDSGIAFQDAGVFKTYGSTTATTTNSALIPAAIYGIKRAR